MLPSLVVALGCWRWRHTENDLNTVAIDLDAPDQGADDVAPTCPVDAIQALADPGRELVQPADDHGQFAGGFHHLGGEPLAFLDLGQAAAQPGDARLELGAVDSPSA
jgi:hypothetical protein